MLIACIYIYIYCIYISIHISIHILEMGHSRSFAAAAIIIYVILIFALIMIKPSFLYDHDKGKFRHGSYETYIPLILFSILAAILVYYFVFALFGGSGANKYKYHSLSLMKYT
jgi:uncharacterized RDD family membrane protein YckC